MTGLFLTTEILEINMYKNLETDSRHYKRRQKKGTPNDEYKNFVNAHLEAAAKCIPTKPRTKYSPMGNVSG